MHRLPQHDAAADDLTRHRCHDPDAIESAATRASDAADSRRTVAPFSTGTSVGSAAADVRHTGKQLGGVTPPPSLC